MAKIAVLGATGVLGSRMLSEAAARGHEVTAVVRDPAKVDTAAENVTAVAADVTDTPALADAFKGQDVVIVALGGGHTPESDQTIIPRGAVSVLDAVRAVGGAQGPRVLWVGGAGSLEIAPGVQLVDTPDFHEAWKAGALAQRDALTVFRGVDAGDVRWTYVSPAALIQPGERTGAYRIGGDQLLTDAAGDSRVSAEDFAVAFLDEAETPRHVGTRITVAY